MLFFFKKQIRPGKQRGTKDWVPERLQKYTLDQYQIIFYVGGQRRKDIPFPHPVMKLADTSPLWRWPEIIDWSLKNEVITEKEALDDAIFIENLNIVLEETIICAHRLRSDLLKVLS